MSLIRTLLRAVQSWRQRRGTTRTHKRADLAMERLDHRQLLAVNFTGNVITDIPDTSTTPGVVILRDNGGVKTPGIPVDLQPFIKVSGLAINGIRLQYTPNDDVLSIGIQQPANGIDGRPVIAGDTDDNLDDGTVSPPVQALRPTFIDFPNFGGSESMGVFLDLTNDGIPDVVAGISGGEGGKLYQVAQATVNPDPALAATTIPQFGAALPNNTGFAFKQNDPDHPNFEFQITHFSELYAAENGGRAIATDSVIRVGGFGNSADDDGIDEAFFPGQPLSFGVVPPTPPPCDCPPQSPQIYVNVHQNNHVNTAHPELVRVSILGTSGFDVTQIDPTTVKLGGASPIARFFRHVNKDGFLDETFVFRGNQITLPPGFTTATVTGEIDNGPNGEAEPFSSSVRIFNRDSSFYPAKELAATAVRRARNTNEIPRFLAGDVLSNPSVTASSVPPVSIRRATRSSQLPRAMRVSDSRAKQMANAAY